MSSPKLSIIVPVYNVESYLEKCLDSLLGQTYSNISIICIDDGSTDKSPNILRNYAAADKRIRVITQANAGQSAARNVGLREVDTEFVTFLDADDYLEPDAYEKAMSLMQDDVDYVCFGTQITWGAYENMRASDEKYYSIKFKGKIQVTTRVLDHTDASLWNKIFRKSILDQYEIDFPENLRYEDAYFFKLYGIRSKCAVYTQEKLHHYVRRENSTMCETFSGKSGRSMDHLKVSIKLYEYLKHHDLLPEYMYFMGAFFFESYYFALRYESSREGKEVIRKYAADFLEREGITFDGFPDFQAKCMHIKLGDLINRHVEKRWGGLLQIQRDVFRIKYFFCGIPLMRIKIRKDYKKYYLFSFIRIKKNKFKNQQPPRPYTPPLLSVVMPTYQAEKTVAHAVRSILDQTYRHLELIIINDGSTDATDDILRSFKDERISLINNNDRPQGELETIKQGIAIARGKYVVLVSAFNEYQVDYLSILMHEFERNRQIDLIIAEGINLCDRNRMSYPAGGISIRRSALEKIIPIISEPTADDGSCPWYEKLSGIKECKKLPWKLFSEHRADTTLHHKAILNVWRHLPQRFRCPEEPVEAMIEERVNTPAVSENPAPSGNDNQATKKCIPYQIVDIMGMHYSGSSAVISFLNEFDNTNAIGFTEPTWSKTGSKETRSECYFFAKSGFWDMVTAFHLTIPEEVDLYIKRFISNLNGCLENGTGFCAWENLPELYGEEFRNISHKLLLSILKLDDYTRTFMQDRLFPTCSNEEGDTTYEGCCFTKERGIRQYLLYQFADMTDEEFHGFIAEFLYDFMSILKGKALVAYDHLLYGKQLDLLNSYLAVPVKQIFVTRDPRDSFLSAYRHDIAWLPRNPQKIASSLKNIVNTFSRSNSNRLYIRFEDLVLKYEETTRKIMDFVGLKPENHVAPKSEFDPAISVMNVGAYHRYHNQGFMKELESSLHELCYYPEKEDLSDESIQLLLSSGNWDEVL